MNDTFKALVARNDDEFSVDYENLTLDDLGDGNVTVQVEYSTLNFKDGLAMTNTAPVVQRYPLVLGIDFAGTVLESGHSRFSAGDKVILNGYGASEYLNGGYSERARVDGDLLVPLPSSLDTRQAMAIGTAGYTAMLSVLSLEEGGVMPDSGEAVSYTHLTLPTMIIRCRSRWSPYH